MKMLRTAFAWLALGLFAGIALGQEYPCDVYIRSAKIYLFRNNPDFESALKNLQEGYEKCYDDPVLHELLGRIYADKNQIDQMAKEFGIAKELGHPKTEEMDKVLESMWSKNFQEGSTALDQVEQVESDSVRQILKQQALKDFEDCILIDSSRYEAYINAASQLVAMGEIARADTHLARAYQLQPDNMSVILNFGINLYNLRNYDKAIEIFEKALELEPNHREVLINLASLYGQVGDHHKSMETWDRLIEKGMADKDIFFNRGTIYLIEAQEVTTRINQLQDSLALLPKNVNLKKKWSN
jgi:tetratricopeptide (TPR) repeat protein